MTDTNVFRAQLLARKSDLLGRLEQVEDLLDDPKSRSFSEQATESEFDEVYAAEGMASEEELAAIDAALNRIDNEIFGTCLSCGELISEARLNAVPFAIHCRNCMR